MTRDLDISENVYVEQDTDLDLVILYSVDPPSSFYLSKEELIAVAAWAADGWKEDRRSDD